MAFNPSREEVKEVFCKPVDERALLSFCFRDSSFLLSLSSRITQRDFLYDEHSVLYTLLSTLSKSGINDFDLPMVINVAQNNGVLESIGGIDYLQAICNMQVSERNFEVYLKNVEQASSKFKLYEVLKDNEQLIQENAKDGKEIDDLIGSVENDILSLSAESKAVKEPRNLSEGLKELIDKRREVAMALMGISTGFPILNQQIDGLVPGTLNIFAARPKVGKSTLLSNIAAHVAYREAVSVLYIDTEMMFDLWRDRILSSMSGIPERLIKHGGYDDAMYQQLLDRCYKIVDKGKLYHEFMPGYTIDKVLALTKKFHFKHNIGLIVFDYIKEPDLASNTLQRKEYQLLGDITTKLKDLAGELNIPALAAVQINRDGEIADSDRIARYADVIGFWSARDAKEIEEWPRETGGSHKIVIRETRRGGATPKEGIGYFFYKSTLFIKEVDMSNQMKKLEFSKGVVNEGSSDDEIR